MSCWPGIFLIDLTLTWLWSESDMLTLILTLTLEKSESSQFNSVNWRQQDTGSKIPVKKVSSERRQLRFKLYKGKFKNLTLSKELWFKHLTWNMFWKIDINASDFVLINNRPIIELTYRGKMSHIVVSRQTF